MRSEQEKLHRHYIAVLIQANRYRRDGNVPSFARMPCPTELGKAIDYAVKELKKNGYGKTKEDSGKFSG